MLDRLMRPDNASKQAPSGGIRWGLFVFMNMEMICGRQVAQWLERDPYKVRVEGSIPSLPTKGGMAELDNAPVLKTGGPRKRSWGFESLFRRHYWRVG